MIGKALRRDNNADEGKGDRHVTSCVFSSEKRNREQERNTFAEEATRNPEKR